MAKPVGFQPARVGGKSYFNTAAYPTVAAQNFKDGSPLIFGTAGNAGKVQEVAANPALVLGCAMQPAFSNPGNELANQSQVVATTGGDVDGCTIALARNNNFVGQAVNGVGNVIQTPVQTQVGVTFGIIKSAVDGQWYIDSTVTGGANDRVKITDIDIGEKLYFFVFLDANVV